MTETRELLTRARVAGMLVKDIAALLGISANQASTYRHYPMPLNNRRVLAAHLDSLTRRTEGGTLYPSQQTAAEHDNVERLSRLTGTRGPIWRMYQELALSILRLAEEGNEPRDRPNGPSGEPESGRTESESGGEAEGSGDERRGGDRNDPDALGYRAAL